MPSFDTTPADNIVPGDDALPKGTRRRRRRRRRAAAVDNRPSMNTIATLGVAALLGYAYLRRSR